MNCSCDITYSPAQQRRGQEQQHEQAVPEPLAAVLEQADVLLVVGLEEEAQGSDLLSSRVSPKMPEGLTSSTASTTT